MASKASLSKDLPIDGQDVESMDDDASFESEDSDIEIERNEPVVCRKHLRTVCSECGLDFTELNKELQH